MAQSTKLKDLDKVIIMGKVGIGDTQPADRLVLKPDANGNSTIRVDHSNDGNGVRFTSIDNAGYKAGIYWNNSGGLEKWRIIADPNGDNTGNLQIRAYSNTITAIELTQNGEIIMPNLPTEEPDTTGAIWNDGGTLKIKS